MFVIIIIGIRDDLVYYIFKMIYDNNYLVVIGVNYRWMVCKVEKI